MTHTYKPVVGVLFSWESQRDQYDKTGEPGIHLETHYAGEGTDDVDLDHPIYCLLFYGEDRRLHGILNTYPNGAPGFEVPRAINLWVDPVRQRRGIGTALVREYERLFGPVDWDAQRVSRAGLLFAEAYRAKAGD